VIVSDAVKESGLLTTALWTLNTETGRSNASMRTRGMASHQIGRLLPVGAPCRLMTVVVRMVTRLEGSNEIRPMLVYVVS
jgi:hypothetical protein